MFIENMDVEIDMEKYIKWLDDNFYITYPDFPDIVPKYIPKGDLGKFLSVYHHPEYVRQEISNRIKLILREDNHRCEDQKIDSRFGETQYCLVTINPDASKIDENSFWPKVAKYVQRSFVEDYKYVFEQRSEVPGVYHGFHSHIFFKRCDKPSVIRKETIKFWSKVVGNSHALDVKYIDQADYDKVLNYLAGKKNDPKKHKKQQNDVLFRQAYGLETIYATRECDTPC